MIVAKNYLGNVLVAGGVLASLLVGAVPALAAAPTGERMAMPISAPAAKSMPPVLADMGSGTTTTCPAFTRGLARGQRDALPSGEISALQKFFAKKYQKNESDIVTGFFGPITESLVKQFQTENGIPAIGLVGPMTRAALGKACGNGAVSASTINLTIPGDKTEFAMGDVIPVTWTTTNLPKDAGMMLQLIAVDSKEVITSITVSPTATSAELMTGEHCNSNFSDAIFSGCENLLDVLKDQKVAFKVHAAIYTPKEMCFGFCMATTTPTVFHGKSESPLFFITNENASVFTGKNTTGDAPLKTTFVINKAGTFTLDFGDDTGMEVKNPQIQCITTPCVNPPKEVTHTYKNPGTYIATLKEIEYNTCKPTADTVCAAWFSKEKAIGKVMIEVTK